MAKSKAKAAKAVTKTTKTPAGTKTTTEVDIVEEERKPAGMEAGIAITTTVVLLIAILMVDHSLGGYGAGMFFK